MGLVRSPLAGVCLLELVSKTPNDHGDGEKGTPGNLGSDCSAETLVIEGISKNVGANNLHQPVEGIIQGARASIEVCAVDRIEVIAVKPIRDKEHGEHENDVWISEERFPIDQRSQTSTRGAA